jgi:hypothetical protein
MFDRLLEHGCVDLSSSMDSAQYSSAAIDSGAFGDIWRGKMNDGTEVAIKSLRLHTIITGDGKGLKVCNVCTLPYCRNSIDRIGCTCVSACNARNLHMESNKAQEYPRVNWYNHVSGTSGYGFAVDGERKPAAVCTTQFVH